MKNTGCFFVCIFLLSIVSCSSQKQAVVSKNTSQTVQTKSGAVRGLCLDEKNVELFAGIPYAQPPLGPLRWKEPQALAPWTGVYDAFAFAPKAMQSKQKWYERFIYRNIIYHDPDGDRSDALEMSEDCLYLNIWRPSTAGSNDKLPVLVYIHGGSLMSGSSATESFDGSTFAQKNIIVVTIAYRLGVFGYFADESLAEESPFGTTGNYGLLDQIAALKWVHENISAFGGNENNITIAGESAGASSVCALCVSPLAKGLFTRAIAESSSLVSRVPPHTFRSMESALEMGKNIQQEFKVSSVEELRNIPAQKLIKTKYANNAMTVDGYALTEAPSDTYVRGANNEEALLNGFNANEAYFFNFFTGMANLKNYRSKIESYFGPFTDEVIELFPAQTNDQAKSFWNDICSAVLFAYGHHQWSSFISSQHKSAWLYYFTKENQGIGTNHSGELIYAYGNVPQTKWYTQEDHQLEDTMVSYWTNFIKTGNPNAQNLPYWQTFSEGKGRLLELGQTVSMTEDPFIQFYPIVTKTMEYTYQH
ncbi:MAG TPA: carboxylesterase [Treponema sp.]|nr:carboxylesterase [Treponema sp.]